jgi:hypothetical protein
MFGGQTLPQTLNAAPSVIRDLRCIRHGIVLSVFFEVGRAPAYRVLGALYLLECGFRHNDVGASPLSGNGLDEGCTSR